MPGIRIQFLGAVLLPGCLLLAGEGLHEPSDEVVCYVNTEKIGKRDVERRIDPLVLARVEDFKRRAIEAGQWNQEAIRQYHALLMPDFRRALRELVREQLLLREAVEKHLEIDEDEFRRRVDAQLLSLRQNSAWIKPDIAGIRAMVRRQMLIQAARRTIVTAMDLPNRPQVEQYYRAHVAEYERPAMVKLRLITVSPGKNENDGIAVSERRPSTIAEELRADVLKGVDFAGLARDRSDDPETRERGGLLLNAEGQPFIDPEQSRFLAPVVRKLKPGSIAERTSDVFLMDNSWALVYLEERRPPGPAKLDTELYENISELLTREMVARKEKEWFARMLKQNLILDGNTPPQPIPLRFFFPDDPTVNG